MNIEKDLFNKYEIDKDKLIKYGFKKENNILLFKKNILDNKFTIIIEYDKEIKGKIIELEFNEEYINFRRESIGTFNKTIKEEFINLLIDIRDKCSRKNIFKYSQTKRINEFIIDKYKVNPEFLWEKFPSYGIYRVLGKWFALIGSVPLNKIDKKSNLNEEVEIINLKVSKDQLNDLLLKKGYFEAYHMNKKSWITIVLNDTLTDNEIKNLIIESYKNIKDGKK